MLDAVFIDINGNKKNFLYQYDKGQTILIENFQYPKAPKVQFSIKSLEYAPSVQSVLDGTTLKAEIPSILLTYGEDILAFLYIDLDTKEYVVETIHISVYQRKKPANYTSPNDMFAHNINGTTLSNNIGFADVALWEDGNKNNDDRSGYFVGVNKNDNGLVISKTSSIENTHGVTTSTVGFAADCDNDKLDINGKLLPQYAYVCSTGFVSVIDDGTCVVGKKCIPNSMGIATLSNDNCGYNVLSRIDDTHVFIFVDISAAQIADFPTSLPADGGNADTVDDHHASDFVLQSKFASQISSINQQVSLAQDTANEAMSMYTYGSEDLIEGISALEDGKLYFVYELQE